MSAIIKASHLACQSGRRYLVKDISWQVEAGEHWIVFGLNGCGKTTLLSMIAGFKGQTGGRLEVFGQEYCADNIFALRRRIGWVSSSFFDKYLSRESVLTIVLSGVSGTLSLSGAITDDDLRRAIALLGKLRLEKKRDQPFALLSKGERQAVLIARALVSRPELLILDEPGTGLDICARERVLAAVEDLACHTAMTIIYVTHYVEEILPAFTKTLFMKEGRIAAQGSTAALFATETLSTFLDYPVTTHCDASGKWQAELTAQAMLRTGEPVPAAQRGGADDDGQ